MSGNSVHACSADPSCGDAVARAVARRPWAVAGSAEHLPPYAGYQSAFHRAFRFELRHMLTDVFRSGVRSALDVACGDGTYACWLGELFGAATLVAAVDADLTWLQTSRRRRERAPHSAGVGGCSPAAVRGRFVRRRLVRSEPVQLARRGGCARGDASRDGAGWIRGGAGERFFA